MKKELALKAGLTPTDDGQYIGTREQWNEYERLEEEENFIDPFDDNN